MDICPVAPVSAVEIVRNLLILLGVLTAIVSVVVVQATAKKKQTADLLFGCRQDKELVEGNQKVAAMHDASGSIRTLAEEINSDTEDAKAVRYVLNHWERVAVGIAQGIYHEEMLRQSNRANVVNLYQKAKPFIQAIRHRHSSDTFYQHFENMALSWEKRPLKVLNTKKHFR